ncbi:MAG: PP2C family protein-serine/threonine phosphatase [Opitutales bacterium]
MIWWHGRRELLRVDEEKQRLQDERTIVVDFMHSLIEAIGRGVDRDKLFEQVVRAAVQSTGALSACIFLREGAELRGVASVGLFPPHRPLPRTVRDTASSRVLFLEQILRAEVFAVGEGLVGQVAQTGRGLHIADATSDPRVIQHTDPVLRVQSCLVVPISFGAQNIAVLALVNRADGNPFDEVDFSLSMALAEQAGLALQNLSLMDVQIERNRLEADLSLASNVQALLLPASFPDLRGLSVAALYEPAQKVGGDLYDLIQLDEQRLAVVIADVSGKGVPASLVMAITQSNFGRIARRRREPLAIMQELNEVLHEQTRDDMFVTAVLAIVDLGAETLTLVRAGHEPPLLYDAASNDAPVTPLRPRGMALGLMGDAVFAPSLEQVTRPFRPGDSLFLYTDGVTEWADAEGVQFGSERLLSTFAGLHGGSAEAVLYGMHDAVRRFGDRSRQADDLTMVVLKRPLE